MAKAKKDDLIRIVNSHDSRFENGDIFRVWDDDGDDGVYVEIPNDPCVLGYSHEYEIHRKAGEEENSMTKAQVGDLIRITQKIELSDDPYAVGDILEVTGRRNEGDIYADYKGAKVVVAECEYEIHRKVGEEDSCNHCGKHGVHTCRGAEYYASLLAGDSESVTFPEDSVGLSYKQLLDVEPQDAVVKPNHYTQGKFETIEVIEEITVGYDDGYVAYCIGNAIKYLARAPYKHETIDQDLAKAEAYIKYAIKRAKGVE